MKQNLEELIYLREEEAMNIELSLNQVKIMKRYWKEFKNYCINKNINYFEFNQINMFLNDCYNCLLSNNNILNSKQKEVIKAMFILIDINNISKYIITTYKDIELNDYYNKKLEEYLYFYENIMNNATSTLTRKKKFTILFFKYLIDNKVNNLTELNKQIILNYIDSLKNNLLNQKITAYWNLKSIFLYLNDSCILQNTFDLLIPTIKRYRHKKLPSCFSKEDVEKLLESLKEDVDNSPAGYRNYAFLLMIARLGIRKIDVINLKWKNIDWERNTITFIQSKTKKANILPLPNDVGEAIINYIRLGRPMKIRNNEDFIFVRNIYPLTKLNNSYTFNDIIKRHMIKCNISLDKYKSKGTHSFRYALATELINEKVPVNIISSVLGHSNSNSTKVYLEINKNALSSCFIGEDYE